MDWIDSKGNTTFTVMRKKTNNDLDTGPKNQITQLCLPTLNKSQDQTFLAGLRWKFMDLLDKNTTT